MFEVKIHRDMSCRFLINIPEEERTDMVRICFQIELAHWFYIDFCRQEDLDLPTCGMQEFMRLIFQSFPFLKNTDDSVDLIYENWKRYKVLVPVYGAILLDESLKQCILVQGFHNKVSWSFPKGKVNKDEDGFDCAVREVKEETGFDITPYSDKQDYIEHNLLDHQVRLYIVQGVPLHTTFEPKTRGEIKEIKWFKVEDLPIHKKDMTPKERLGLNPNSFFMVQPFVRHLRKWLNQRAESIHCDTDEKASTTESTSLRFPKDKSEQNVQKQREQMQRKFQEMHRLSHPLRTQPTEREQNLLCLLGLADRASSTKKIKQSSPINSPRKAPETQPEAIRKLLTGTVTSSPVTTPEKQGFQGTIPVVFPVSSVDKNVAYSNRHSYPSYKARDSVEETSNAMKKLMFKEYHSDSPHPKSLKDLKQHGYFTAASGWDLKQHGSIPKGRKTWEKQSFEETGENSDKKEIFSFRAPAWTNFSFSRDLILNTLP